VKLAPAAREGRERHGADVSMKLNDGREIKISYNVGIPASDVAAQEAKLVAKFNALVEPVLGRARAKTALDMIMRFEKLPSLKGLMETVA
jgi:hypothetical protein